MTRQKSKKTRHEVAEVLRMVVLGEQRMLKQWATIMVAEWRRSKRTVMLKGLKWGMIVVALVGLLVVVRMMVVVVVVRVVHWRWWCRWWWWWWAGWKNVFQNHVPFGF